MQSILSFNRRQRKTYNCITYNIYNLTAMFENYFKTTLRTLIKDKRSTLLNLFGLSTGLACAILIFMWVSDELTMDKFFKNDSRLYQVMENRVQADGIWTAPSTSGLMADAMKKDLPQVEYAV